MSDLLAKAEGDESVTVVSQSRSFSVRKLLPDKGVYVFLAVLFIVSGLISPSFFSSNNLGNLLSQLAPLGLVVLGQAFVILVRGLDLSVASIMATAAVAATSLSGRNSDVPAVLAIGVGIGALTGLANGILVTKRQVSPFLATLATMIVLQGIRFAWTQGAPSGSVPPLLRLIGAGNYHGVPYNALILAIIAIPLVILLHSSAFGRRVYLTGGNPGMARLVGIHADRVIITCYVISGVLAALSGLMLSGFVGVVDNWVGRGFELNSIVAAVIGGVALSGGRGTLPGALAGAAILVTVFNAVLLFGLSVQFQIIIQGCVIILATAFYARRQT
jgi:ribose/xylose/arabinose/galactoside ABC-type transport system permease subunit